MTSILSYGRWILSGSWWLRRPTGSALTWGRLVASWAIITVLVSLMFALLAAGGFLNGVAVALLWPSGQIAVVVGLVYAARTLRGTS